MEWLYINWQAVLAAIALPMALYGLLQAQRASRPRRRLNYYTQSMRRSTEANRTSLHFWNDGCDTVMGANTLEGLKVKATNGGKILSASVLRATHPKNGIECKLSEDGNAVSVSFMFLDDQQGGVLELNHTGDGSFTMEGVIMGCPHIQAVKPTPWTSTSRMAFLVSLGLVAVGQLPMFFSDGDMSKPVAHILAGAILIGLFSATVRLAPDMPAALKLPRVESRLSSTTVDGLLAGDSAPPSAPPSMP